jgi:2-dehydro-3-deoxy-D-arabinonate dehydratase
MRKLYCTSHGLVVVDPDRTVALDKRATIDQLFTAADPGAWIDQALEQGRPVGALPPALQAPLNAQEVWAAGVTYYRSRTARMDESRASGGGSFYDKVYEADRPELFFKATRHRVADPGGTVRIRRDSRWNVPEPELTLAVNSAGRIFGYTIGNDMSSRDIEGENPLYLPQAKVYSRSAAIGPCIVVTDELPAADTSISIVIRRAGRDVFKGETLVGEIKRPLPSLVQWLFCENDFPAGCYLMTGTGVVPPDSFTLQEADEIRITVPEVGTLVNRVS